MGSGAGCSQFVGTLETLQPADALLVVVFPAGLVAAERGVQLEQPQRPSGQRGHKPDMSQNAVAALAASAARGDKAVRRLQAALIERCRVLDRKHRPLEPAPLNQPLLMRLQDVIHVHRRGSTTADKPPSAPPWAGK